MNTDSIDNSSNFPPAGWSGPDRWDHLSFVHHGPSFLVKPPTKDGWKVFFVGKFGLKYTSWTYKRVEQS